MKTRRTARILDVFALLLKQRYVTIRDIADGFDVDESSARRAIKRIAQRYELVIERDAIPTRSRNHLMSTAYYFRREYKLRLIGGK